MYDEKYQFELCSKHDRVHDFDVILGYKSHLVASCGGHVASIQMMSRVRHERLHYTMIVKHIGTAKNAF